MNIWNLEVENPQDVLYENEISIKEMIERLFQYTKFSKNSGRLTVVFWPKDYEVFSDYRDQLRAR